MARIEATRASRNSSHHGRGHRHSDRSRPRTTPLPDGLATGSRGGYAPAAPASGRRVGVLGVTGGSALASARSPRYRGGMQDADGRSSAGGAGVVLVGPWRRRSRRPVYANPWMEVFHDEVDRPDGSPGIYGVVHFRHLAVGVIA